MKRSAASLACEDASSTCVARHPSGSQTPSHGCLGKHADSIVVDTQASGFECMNVRGGRCRHVALTRAHVWTHCGEGVSVVYSGSTIRTQNGNEENNTCTP